MAAHPTHPYLHSRSFHAARGGLSILAGRFEERSQTTRAAPQQADRSAGNGGFDMAQGGRSGMEVAILVTGGLEQVGITQPRNALDGECRRARPAAAGTATA